MSCLADSHCHLDADAFDGDRDVVLERARAAGVDTFIVPAVAAAGWDKLLTMCRAHRHLHPALGLHPAAIAGHQPADLLRLRMHLEAGGVVAVGECGLDFWTGQADREPQLQYFRAQVDLAREFDLPLIIHARRALDQVLAVLRRARSARGVVHSFAGSRRQAEQLWQLGFSIGIGGPVTHLRASRLRQLVASMPLEHLLLETDSPDQSGAAHRGQRNEPAFLTEVVTTVATLRGTTRDAVATATRDNCRRLFRVS